jgi:hypothetical protein
MAAWNRSGAPGRAAVALVALIWVMASIFPARTVDRRAAFSLQCTIAPIAALATDLDFCRGAVLARPVNANADIEACRGDAPSL